jgi:2'-5' RNA ligase
MAHADSSHVIRTSLWIRPKGEALDRIRHAIRRAHQHDGGLPVDPHVTLLSGCKVVESDAREKLRRLVERVRQFSIRLGRIEGTADHYRALYAVVEPSAELAAARQAACETFETKPLSFEPHLSLLYGNFGEARREALTAALGGRLDVSFTAAAVDLVSAARDVPVADWRTLYEHPLAEK